MDAVQFDTLALRVARLTTRRSVFRLLLGLPAPAAALLGLGAEPALVSAEDDDHGSSHRRRRRRTRHKHRKNRVRRNKKHKKRKKRKPKARCTPRTCPANGCGSMPDGCGGTLQCGGCGSNQLCVDGACRKCDVCQQAGACDFISVQAAIDATNPQRETIVVCPGTYQEDTTNADAIIINRSLRLVGAGDGDNPDTNTILRPHHDGQSVILIHGTPGMTHVTLERVQITGANGNINNGIHVNNVVFDMIGCTVTDNTSSVHPGGIQAFNTTLTLTDTRITGNRGFEAGGMLVLESSQVTFDTLSRVTDNTATNGNGGIRAEAGTSVVLPSVDNVTGNTSSGDNKNCGGGGVFDGGGNICTTK